MRIKNITLVCGIICLLCNIGDAFSRKKLWKSFHAKAEAGATDSVYGMNIENGGTHKIFSGEEAWAYVTVRPKAHMFYWLYYTTHSSGYEERPLILWLQGGPGGSGTGFGNFQELGPLDVNLKPRNTTWLQTASLLFIDNPIGTGYSYAEDDSGFTTNVAEISSDLLTCMQTFIELHHEFQTVPFYIFSESYGGKMTAAFSAVLYDAIGAGKIKMNFKGFAMGDSWISPVDSVNSWGPYLFATSIISVAGLEALDKGAKRISDLCTEGKWVEATEAWSAQEDIVEDYGSGVNFYNIMQWEGSEKRMSLSNRLGHNNYFEKLYNRHVLPMQEDKLTELMNGPIKKKLKIIPDSVAWGAQSGKVFEKQQNDFMKNVTSTVNSLINKSSLKVVVYSGQLDLICDVLGTEKWFSRLDIAPEFFQGKKKAHTCSSKGSVCYFTKELRNVQFYWILDAGHMVPTDNGLGALAMVNSIIGA